MPVKSPVTFALLLTAIGILSCVAPNNHGGTDTGNAAVIGKLYLSDGKTPAAGVRVHIRPKKSLADTSTGLAKSLAMLAATDSVVTDSTGRFAFDSTLDTGTYVIEAASGNDAVLIDSVAVTAQDSTDSLPPDILKPAGALKGVIKLSEGGDPRKVFVLAFGIDRFARVNADGSFKFSNLAEAKYDLRLISSLDNYGVLDTNAISVRSADTTDLDTITLSFTGVPTPKNVKISYDTLKQIVTLTWSKADTALVKSYNVYRRNVGLNTVLARINANPVSDTVYRDSTGVQDSTYEYRVAAVNAGATEGTKSTASLVIVASYFVVDTSFGGPGSGVGQFNYPSDIAIAENGDIYIVEVSNNRVQVFGSDFVPKRQFGSNVLKKPSKIDIAKNGTAYVAVADTVFVFDTTGTLTKQIPAGAYIYDIVLDSNYIIVLTYGNTVSMFSYAGTKIRSWPCGEYNSSEWLTMLDPNRIFLSNRIENSLKVFDSLGILIKSIGIKPDNSMPGCIAIDKMNKRTLVACESGSFGNKLKVFDSSFTLIADYKIPCRGGEPTAITINPNGFIFVALGTSNKILRLRNLLP